MKRKFAYIEIISSILPYFVMGFVNMVCVANENKEKANGRVYHYRISISSALQWEGGSGKSAQ